MTDLITTEETLEFKTKAWKAFDDFRSYVVEQANESFRGRIIEMGDDFFENDVFVMSRKSVRRNGGCYDHMDDLLRARDEGVKKIRITEFFMTDQLILSFDWEPVSEDGGEG